MDTDSFMFSFNPYTGLIDDWKNFSNLYILAI